MSDIIERSQIHATFVVERSYPVPVSAVWHALSDNDARDQWFGGGADFDVQEEAKKAFKGSSTTSVPSSPAVPEHLFRVPVLGHCVRLGMSSVRVRRCAVYGMDIWAGMVARGPPRTSPCCLPTWWVRRSCRRV